MKAGLSPAQQIDWQLYARRAHWFVFGQPDGARVLWTKDEHDHDSPEKLFPDYPYLRCLLDCLLVSGRWIAPDAATHALQWSIPLAHLAQQAVTGTLFIEKSRQVLASWLCCAYILWRAKFHAHQLLLVQSKKEEDASKFVYTKEAQHARISFMESRLPDWMQDGLFVSTNDKRKSNLPMHMRRADNGHLWFSNGSHIWAVPQGGNIIRSHTPSLLFSDECAFQPDFGLAYNAALPALRGGGQLVAVSSAEIGDFATIVEAEI